MINKTITVEKLAIIFVSIFTILSVLHTPIVIKLAAYSICLVLLCISFGVKKIIYDKFDKIILALPAHATKKIWAKSNFSETNESKKWELQKTRGINTLWIALPKNFKRKSEIFSNNYWEIIKLSKCHDESLFVVVERPFYQSRMVLSVVQSAINFKEEKNLEKAINKLNINIKKLRLELEKELKTFFSLWDERLMLRKNGRWSPGVKELRNIPLTKKLSGFLRGKL